MLRLTPSFSGAERLCAVRRTSRDAMIEELSRRLSNGRHGRSVSPSSCTSRRTASFSYHGTNFTLDGSPYSWRSNTLTLDETSRILYIYTVTREQTP